MTRRTRRWSLRRRLTRRVVAIALLGWGAILAIGFAVMWQEMREIQDDALADEAALVLIAVMGSAQPLIVTHDNLRIETPFGTTGQASWLPLAHDGLSEVGPWQIFRVSDPSGYAVEVGGLSVERHEDFLEATWAFTKPMLPVLLLLIVVVRVTTRSAVAPVKDFAMSLANRNAEDLSPVAETGLPDEFLSTPRALNHYLDRLRTLREAERHFAANAAHELRTPLAAASAQAQLLVQGRASPEAAQTIADAISRLTVIVSRLLQLARAESGLACASRQTDIVRVLRMLIADHGSGQILFDDGDIEELRISVDPDALAILLGNLIDNAQMHGDGPIRIKLRQGPIITISNPVDPDATFHEDRFARGPKSTGSGLGLSIIRAIASQIGMILRFDISNGTARVVLDGSTATPSLAPTSPLSNQEKSRAPRPTVNASAKLALAVTPVTAESNFSQTLTSKAARAD